MAAEKPIKSMLARQGTKVAKGTPARSDAKVVKTCGGFQAPLMVFSDFYEKQMVEDPPVNRGRAPTPAPEPDSEPEAETEQTEEMPKEQTVTEVETYRMPQIPLPEGLPRPGVPKKPSWWEIGWRRLMGRSVNDTIWDRWCPPEPSNYAELVCPCKDYVYLGEINEEELNRLNFELRELSSMMADSQDVDTQNEVEVGVAINRGTSGGIKVLSGTIMIVGSVAGIAAVAASGGTALPVVVMALGTAMIMFGASDTIEGIGDIQAAISHQGLDQMSYNPVRESVFNGNETAYTLTETGVSFVFDVITGMAIAKMPTRLKTPAQAFRATSAAGKAGAAVEATEESSKMVRVGRWMSRAEYDKMVKTGYVQKPYNANQSYVANPADYNAFYKQAKKGSVYVEFDVPLSSVKQTKDVWAAIPGPNSMYSKLDLQKGLPQYEFPKAINIELVGEK